MKRYFPHEYFRPRDVLTFARMRESMGDYSWNYIILGRTGPTGKSYLCQLLKDCGFHATEITESIYPFVDFWDDKNHFMIDISRKHVVIILNRPLKKLMYGYCWS